MFDIKAYYYAETLEDALVLLTQHPHARIIAGGSDVLIKIREGKYAGCELVSIGTIKELKGVSLMENGDIRIGALTTFSHLTADPLIQQYLPVLGEAVDQVGGPQIRNVGTIGGNLCNGAVSADSAPAIFCYNANLVIRGLDYERISSIHDFYLGPGKTDLRPGEILTHILISQKNYEGFSGHYIKYSMRNAMDIATLSCCVTVKAADDTLEDLRITFGVAAPTPFRCKSSEEALKGCKINEDLYAQLSSHIKEEINPRDSWRASKAFRIQIGQELAQRALKSALRQGEYR